MGIVVAITVLIADAQPLFAEALATALEDEADLQVLEARPTRGGQLLEAARRLRPDVALIDLWLPGGKQAAVVAAFRDAVPDTAVLVLSGLHGPDHIEAVLEAGAVGFLPKGVSLEQVVEAVRRAHAGAPRVFATEVAGLARRLDRRREVVASVEERLAELTPRQVEVLRVAAAGGSSADIAEQLGVSAATVRRHIHNILKRTGAVSRLDAVGLAREHGLIPRE